MSACPVCRQSMCICSTANPWRAGYDPNRTPMVPIIGVTEQSRVGIVNIERGVFIIDAKPGFIPVILALTYSTDHAANAAPAPHPIQVDWATAGDGVAITADTAPRYTLVDEDVVYWTLVSQGYAGIPVPLFAGNNVPYSIRFTTGPALPLNLTRQFRVCYGYRPLDQRPLPQLGPR